MHQKRVDKCKFFTSHRSIEPAVITERDPFKTIKVESDTYAVATRCYDTVLNLD